MVQATRVTNADLYEKIGRLLEGQEHAREGRKVIHERLDDMAKGVGKLATAVTEQAHVLRVNTDVQAQLRSSIDTLRAEVDDEIKPGLEAVVAFKDESKPLVDSMRHARNVMIAVVAVFGFAGVSVTGTLVLANDFAKAVIRDWLRDEAAVHEAVPPTR